jgi:ElaB/YqjD/DUF883 family membrane-anchored ribosome-binding protein
MLMLTTHPSSVVQKRDLHVGGLGFGASGALAAITDPIREPSDPWLEAAHDAMHDADDYVHERPPWVALTFVALLGLTAGLLLSRRASS